MKIVNPMTDYENTILARIANKNKIKRKKQIKDQLKELRDESIRKDR